MTDRQDTAALIREARERLSSARAEADEAEARLESAREEVRKYESFLSVLGEFTGNGAVPTADMDAEKRSLTDPDLTIAEAAEIVLRRVGKPLKNRQMAERMVEGGFPYDKEITKLRNSVGTILDRKAGKGDTFKKHAPGIFGLQDWEE